MSDYVKLARINLDAANGQPSQQADGIIAAAGVFATLAVAEQLERIADALEKD